MDGKSEIYKMRGWRVTCRAYWLFEKPPATITVRLFADTGRAYWDGEGRIEVITRPGIYDMLIPDSINIIGSDVLRAGVLPPEDEGVK